MNKFVVFNKNIVHTASDKFKENEVPVYIVDEHHEVIPHWFRGIDNGIVSRDKNILIHIDGHSDMAPPEDFKPLKKFKYVKNQLKESFFPLMQSNDVFIQSAIYHELINYVVWVQPSWNRGHYRTESNKCFVGITIENSTKTERFCTCMKESGKKMEDIDCSYVSTLSEEREEQEIDISQCKKEKEFKWVTISEDKIQKLITFRKKAKHFIVDIDEDYFGVESGVQKFMDMGVEVETVVKIDEIFSSLFYVDTNELEIELNLKVKEYFKSLLKIVNLEREEKESRIYKSFLPAFESYFRKEEDQELDIFIDTLSTVLAESSEKELRGLSDIHYCLDGTPQMANLHSFKICHGNIFPGDPLNQIYTSDVKEIETRGEKLTDILSFVGNHSIPQMFTVCRSLRDGYTPRYLQNIIEKRILTSISTSLAKFGKKPKIIYDPYLLNGKAGWYSSSPKL